MPTPPAPVRALLVATMDKWYPDVFGNTGRIVSASIGGGSVKVEIETPK